MAQGGHQEERVRVLAQRGGYGEHCPSAFDMQVQLEAQLVEAGAPVEAGAELSLWLNVWGQTLQTGGKWKTDQVPGYNPTLL